MKIDFFAKIKYTTAFKKRKSIATSLIPKWKKDLNK
jgi:hypothetical protein